MNVLLFEILGHIFLDHHLQFYLCILLQPLQGERTKQKYKKKNVKLLNQNETNIIESFISVEKKNFDITFLVINISKLTTTKDFYYKVFESKFTD